MYNHLRTDSISDSGSDDGGLSGDGDADPSGVESSATVANARVPSGESGDGWETKTKKSPRAGKDRELNKMKYHFYDMMFTYKIVEW